MNVKTGAYAIPKEIQDLVPEEIPCRIEVQLYQPKKNGQPTGPSRKYYYVYEDRSADKQGTGKSGRGRKLLGKIIDNRFIPNKHGLMILKEHNTSFPDEPVKAETAQKARGPFPETEAGSAYDLPEGLKKVSPGICDIDNKDYGEFALVLASTKEVLEELKQFFHPQDAIWMYALSIICLIEPYIPACCCGDRFKQSILSIKWPMLSFDEDSINTFLRNIGQHGLMCERYSQYLIDKSSECIVMTAQGIMPDPQQNELKEFGYRFGELNHQVHLIALLDAENKRHLASKMMYGPLPDRLSVHELFAAFKFSHKTFLADSEFYSEENIGVLRNNGNHFVISVPDTCEHARKIKENVSFEESFVYEHMNGDGSKTERIILYKESTVGELEALDDKEMEEVRSKAQKEETAENVDSRYKRKSRWSEDRVIVYMDRAMHDQLVYDYRGGIDARYTEEQFQRISSFWGVIVLRVSKPQSGLTAKDAYLAYKKRWAIEPLDHSVSNGVRLEEKQIQDYYMMQGFSFMTLLAGRVKRVCADKLRGSALKNVNGLSLRESIIKAKYGKIVKHPDNRWYVCVLNDDVEELLCEMGVSIEEDMVKLNNGTF